MTKRTTERTTAREEAERAIDLHLRGWVSSVAGQGNDTQYGEWVRAVQAGDYAEAARLSGGAARGYEDAPVRVTPLREVPQPNGSCLWSKLAVVGPVKGMVDVARATVDNDDPDYDGPPAFWELCLSEVEWRQLGEWARG